MHTIFAEHCPISQWLHMDIRPPQCTVWTQLICISSQQ